MSVFTIGNYNHRLNEMARVGVVSDSVEIQIYSKEGPIPHFHFYHKQSKRRGCVRLDCAEYFKHGIHVNSLTKKEIIDLNDWVRSDETPFKKYGANINIFTYMLILWNENNPNYLIDDIDNMVISNYTELNKERTL